VPAAFTLATTRDHWATLLRARAIENQAFVVAANQIGEFVPGRVGGRSMIVDPWGVVLAQAADREGYILAELDLADQDRIRSELPSLANRRPEVYRGEAGGASQALHDGHGTGRADGGEIALTAISSARTGAER
jgi:predicted amidohydrolase